MCGSAETITADRFVLAAGSRVWLPTIAGLDQVRGPHLRHGDAARRACRSPMIIIGGGYVAAEFAHVFSAFGTAVTIINRSAMLLRHEDDDISRRLHRSCSAARSGVPAESKIDRVSQAAGRGQVRGHRCDE